MKIIPHYPQTQTGMHDLAQRVSAAQAAFVGDRLRALICPQEQKRALLEAVLETSQRLEAEAAKPRAGAPDA